MTHIGTVHGNRIELEEPVNLPQGARVHVVILPLTEPDSRRLIGLFAQDADVLDCLIETVTHERETRPLRGDNGQSLT